MSSEKNTDRLIEVYKLVYSAPRLPLLLTVIGYTSVAVVAASFIAVAVRTFAADPTSGIELLLAALIPFLLVSVMRCVINAKRPYELYDFSSFAGGAPKRKLGRSFPSRHVASAFLIGVLLIPYSLPLAVLSLVLGAVLSVCRVLLGIHFIRDVVVGAVIGVISGVLGILIL